MISGLMDAQSDFSNTESRLLNRQFLVRYYTLNVDQSLYAHKCYRLMPELITLLREIPRSDVNSEMVRGVGFEPMHPRSYPGNSTSNGLFSSENVDDQLAPFRNRKLEGVTLGVIPRVFRVGQQPLQIPSLTRFYHSMIDA